MSATFSEFLDRCVPNGPPPSDEAVVAVCTGLRRLLVRELRLRGLWRQPPSYLGIYGGRRWTEPDTLDELVAECYCYVFVHRLRSLRAQLRVKGEVEGLVALNVKHFVFDTQKKHDPLGYRIYDLLQEAILKSAEKGTVQIEGAGRRLTNDSLLAFRPRPTDVEPDLEQRLRDWNDLLMPALVTARGPGRRAVVEHLSELLDELRADGFGQVRLRDLAGPLKRDVRRRWQALWRQEKGEHAVEDDAPDAGRVPVFWPTQDFDELDHLARLFPRVAEAIDGLDETAATRRYLERLWQFHHEQCLDPSASAAVSHHRIATLLAIPRYRLPGLYQILGRLVERCDGPTPAARTSSPP